MSTNEDLIKRFDLFEKNMTKRLNVFEEDMINRFNVFGREVTRKIGALHGCVDQRLGRIETDVAEIKDILINGRGKSHFESPGKRQKE